MAEGPPHSRHATAGRMNKQSEKIQETYFLLASTRGVFVFWASTPGVFEEGPGCQPPRSVHLHGGGWDGLQEDKEGSKKTEEGVHMWGVNLDNHPRSLR